MINKIRVFFFIIILILTILTINFSSNAIYASGREITVGTSDSANFSSIQKAVNNASDNDTIIVENNIYNEKIVINKTITLIAKPGATITSENDISGFYLLCNNTIIIGFKIKNNDIGVFIEKGYGNKVFNNTFESNINSVYLSNTSLNIISDNYFISNTEGLRLFQSSINTIRNNRFIDHSSKSIYLWEKSDENIIFNNNITDGGSISLQRWCNNNLICNNYLEEASVKLHKCFFNVISDNIIKYTSKGVVLSYSSNNTVKNNKFESCEICGVYSDNSENNIIESNDYIDTPESVKEKRQAPKIKIPGFELMLFFVVLFFFFIFRKKI